MEVSAISSTTAAASGAQSVTGSLQKTLGVNDFLKLLTVQITTQDPLEPLKDTDFIAQMANFTSLEQMRSLSTDFAGFTKEQRMTGAQAYLGKEVTVSAGSNGAVTGTVTAVSLDGDTPQLTVNALKYDLSAVQSVTVPETAAPSTDTNPHT